MITAFCVLLVLIVVTGFVLLILDEALEPVWSTFLRWTVGVGMTTIALFVFSLQLRNYIDEAMESITLVHLEGMQIEGGLCIRAGAGRTTLMHGCEPAKEVYVPGAESSHLTFKNNIIKEATGEADGEAAATKIQAGEGR